ncbi:MAG: ribosome maturation factor RimM [Alphaproteobacteria bacterium]
MASQLHLTPKEGLIRLGHIQSAQGLKGQVRIFSETENPADICNYSPLWDAKGEQQFMLHFLRMHKDSVICSIDNVDDRTKAEALKGMMLCVEREQLPKANEDEFYHADLLELEVRDMSNKLVGHIKAVQDFGAGDLLDIMFSEERIRAYLPFTKEFVPVVNIADGFVQIDAPEDLVSPPKSGARRRRPPGK